MAPVRARVSILVLAAIAMAVAESRHAALDPAPEALQSFIASQQSLPAGLVLPPVEASRLVVGVVAADIDADGDLDVVVNEGTLDLVVWVNDGTGRLTRKSASHSSDWEPLPPIPSLGGPSAAVAVSVLNDVPSIGADLREASIVLARSQLPASSESSAVPLRSTSSHTPRAPPAVS